MFDRVNNSMAICYATFAPPTTVQDYFHSIMAAPHCQPVCKQALTDEPKRTDPVYCHPQALKTIHMPIPKEYIMANQEMLAPRLPIPQSQHDQPAISKMTCMFPKCVAQGESGANRALTDNITLLTDFMPINPFQVCTIGPKLIMATH